MDARWIFAIAAVGIALIAWILSRRTPPPLDVVLLGGGGGGCRYGEFDREDDQVLAPSPRNHSLRAKDGECGCANTCAIRGDCRGYSFDGVPFPGKNCILSRGGNEDPIMVPGQGVRSGIKRSFGSPGMRCYCPSNKKTYSPKDCLMKCPTKECYCKPTLLPAMANGASCGCSDGCACRGANGGGGGGRGRLVASCAL